MLLLLLSCGSVEPAASPVAGFTYGCNAFADSAILFTSTSVNASAWEWDFGNGTSSVEKNPTVRFGHPGTFRVTLTARSSDGASAQISRMVRVFDSMPAVKVLPIDFYSRQKSGWALAAVGEMILRYDSINVKQCEMIGAVNRVYCCNTPDDCNYLVIDTDLDRILNAFGRLETVPQQAPLTLERIRSEIAQDRPVVAFYYNDNENTFAARLLVGYRGEDEVLVYDPQADNSTSGRYWGTYEEMLEYVPRTGVYLDWRKSLYCIRK